MLKKFGLFFIIVSVLSVGCVLYLKYFSNEATKPNTCFIPAQGEGPCLGMFPGVQYNSKENKCEKIYLSGCETKSVFASIEQCQSTCE